MIRHGYDVTNGIVIGELSAGYRILYDDREQHRWTDKQMTDREAKEEAEKWLAGQKQEIGKLIFKQIYPDNKWELRIYG